MIALEALVRQYPEELKGFKRNIIAEYLQCRALSCICESQKGAKLIFMGGTAIRLCHDSMRFSEDLDFDNTGISQADFKKIAGGVSKRLEMEGYKNEVDFSFKGAFRAFLRFEGIFYNYGLSSHENEKLLLQIDAEPQNIKYKTKTHVINKFGVFSRVVVPTAPVLLSMKISALLGRRREKGRDFYDVTFLSAFAGPDFKYLSEKAGIKNKEELKAALLEKVSGLNMKAVSADVSPFLFKKSDEQRVLYFEDFVRSM